ncbi:MAG: Segregation and condensation protein B [Firmicutes bacterium]|nr:Segregation and condensation protein B [candidate division NPL-UPA2 bacterium]
MLDRLGLLEAVLFAALEPIGETKLCNLLGISANDLALLIDDYQASLKEPRRGITLRAVAGGWQLVTKPETAELVSQLTSQRRYRLSKPALEVLAIVAYRQPITRLEIEELRGVQCERSLLTLMERNLICAVGRKEAVGRPILYGTTDTFLEQFNLCSLKDLPSSRS